MAGPLAKHLNELKRYYSKSELKKDVDTVGKTLASKAPPQLDSPTKLTNNDKAKLRRWAIRTAEDVGGIGSIQLLSGPAATSARRVLEDIAVPRGDRLSRMWQDYRAFPIAKLDNYNKPTIQLLTEIPDNMATLSPDIGKFIARGNALQGTDRAPVSYMSRLLNHPELQQAHPWLDNTSIHHKGKSDSIGGYFDGTNNIIGLYSQNASNLLDDLLHESTHAIAKHYNLPAGTSSAYYVARPNFNSLVETQRNRFNSFDRSKLESLYGKLPKNNLDDEMAYRFDSLYGDKSDVAKELYRSDLGEALARMVSNRSKYTNQQLNDIHPIMSMLLEGYPLETSHIQGIGTNIR